MSARAAHDNSENAAYGHMEQEPLECLNKGDQLNKQNSIFSLTLDEIQNKSGKNFGSMNMDEFLSHVWSVEEEDQSQSLLNETSDDKCQPSLTRQGSFSVPISLCNKTVDEVWFEIQEPQEYKPGNMDVRAHKLSQCQQTFQEMTLEHFLVKAGIVQEAAKSSLQQKVTIQPFQNQCGGSFVGKNEHLSANAGMGQLMSLGFPIQQNIDNDNMPANAFVPYELITKKNSRSFAESTNGNENEACLSLGDFSGGAKNRKRIVNGPPEVLVERRHRRMIKNRESAARSRARKQAYTIELEVELNQLKDENEKLKKILAEIELRKKQESQGLKKEKTTKEQENAEILGT